MRKIILTLFAVSYVLSAQGCMSFVSDSFQIPNNRFQSSETSGGLGDGLIAAGYGNKTMAILTHPTAANDQDVINSSKVNAHEGMYLQASAGLHQKVDFLFYNGAMGLKLQAVGAPASEAKAGNRSLSLGLAVDRGSSSSTNYNKKSQVEYSGVDAMIIAGYRIKDSQLIYANIASSSFSASGSLTTESGSGTTAVTSTILKGPRRDVRETSLLVGWQGLNERVFVMLEAGYTIANMQGKNSARGLSLGGSFGARW